jgi:hypothetical protein
MVWRFRGIINLGVNFSGSLRISETISIPAFSSLIFNPEAGNIYLVAGSPLDSPGRCAGAIKTETVKSLIN